jgi:hypothetical protein
VSDGCLSDLACDRLRTGELDEVRAAGLRAHLAGCAGCRERYAALEAEAGQFLAKRPALDGATSRGRANVVSLAARPRRAGRRLAVAVSSLGALAAAAALLLVLRPPGPGPGFRTKGSFNLDAYSKRRGDGHVTLVLPRGTAHPGDALRFRLSSARPGFVGLVSFDGAGTVSSYLPGEPALVSIAAGESQLPAGSIELDGTLGRERVVALLCAEPVATAQLLAAARTALAAAAGDAERVELTGVGRDCSQTSLTFIKVAAP